MEQWEEHKVASSGKTQYKAKGKDLYMLKLDMLMRMDPEMSTVVQDPRADVRIGIRSSWAARQECMFCMSCGYAGTSRKT